jgi:hypothetical protein
MAAANATNGESEAYTRPTATMNNKSALGASGEHLLRVTYWGTLTSKCEGARVFRCQVGVGCGEEVGRWWNVS